MPKDMTNKIDIHASAAALDGQAVLILGRPRTGKSELLRRLMAFGFELVGDDSIVISEAENGLWVSPNPKADGRMEVRGMGIHQSSEFTEGLVAIVVDMNDAPANRLPKSEYYEQFGCKVPKISGQGCRSLEQYLYLLMSGRLKRLELG